MLTFTRAERINDVPPTWVYHYYLGIKSPLNGQPFKTRSFINSDTSPSLCLFVKSGQYKWKDFSSGEGGSYIDLVICKVKHETGHKLSYIEACKKIVEDYNNYTKVHGIFKPEKLEPEITEYELDVDFEKTSWRDVDNEFWYDRFGIREKTTSKFNIYPLKYYKLRKKYATYIKEFPKIEGDNIYGYFNDKGELYQIYQPYNKEMKFIKLKRYLQGYDQLEGKHDVLIIGSSLKDIAVIDTLELNLEVLAPPSESTLLGVEDVKTLRKKYKYIFTLFDNDDAGIKAMLKYYNLYGIDYIVFPYEKDIAECKEMSGKKFLKEELTIRINKKINEKN